MKCEDRNIMSNRKKAGTKQSKDFVEVAMPTKNVVENGKIPPELAPVVEWYNEKGREWLYAIVVVLIAFTAFFSYKRHVASKNSQASAAIAEADTIDGLESLNSQYGRTAAGQAIRFKLAKAYLDADNFDGARDAFQAIARKGGPLSKFAKLGVAAANEGARKFDEAIADYEKLAADESIAVQAKFGLARCMAAKGDKQKAVELLDAVAADKPDFADAAASLKKVVENFEGFKDVSVFDSIMTPAEAAAPAAEEAPAPAAPAAEEDPAPAAEEAK